VLVARAKELDAEHFKTVAAREIRDQIRILVREQLEYAAAERNLDQKDKDLADFLTEQWRDRQATAAGGSIELAKKLAKERGRDFDELMQDQYRLIMSRIYLDRKIVPPSCQRHDMLLRSQSERVHRPRRRAVPPDRDQRPQDDR
jgi:hypothetical protein